jgi:PadR family transcriptional regulator, regulatory protein AphA
MIQNILLGFLNYRSMTGYELKQIIDHSTAHFWHAYHSQIYTMLRQMEKDGLVTSQFLDEEGQPRKRVYTITEAGRTALTVWLDQSMLEMSPIKEELLVRLFFSARRDPQKVLDELTFQRQLHAQKLNDYRTETQTHENFACEPGFERDEHFWQATLNLGMHYEEVYIAWLDETLQMVKDFSVSFVSSQK